MGNYIGFLITVLYNDRLVKCALSINKEKVPFEIWAYPEKQSSKDALRRLLPPHVKDCGPIVEVEELFEVAEANYEEGGR